MTGTFESSGMLRMVQPVLRKVVKSTSKSQGANNTSEDAGVAAKQPELSKREHAPLCFTTTIL
jgi:hypothetical protein